MNYHAHKKGNRFYPLSEHLAETAAGAAERLSAHPRRSQLSSVALLAGWTHDFGKYTPFFQSYLRTGFGGPEKQHAFISALWAAYLAEQIEIPPLHSLALFLSICRHHRRLSDPEEMLLPLRELKDASWDHLEPAASERLYITEKQIDSLRPDKNLKAVALSLKSAAQQTAKLLKQTNMPTPGWLNSDWPALLRGFFDKWTQSYGSLYRYRRRQLRGGNDAGVQTYFDLLTLFSALIDADKIHAARLKDSERIFIPQQPVEKYRKVRFGPPKSAVNRLRNELYNTVCVTVEKAPLTQKLFTITAPTGSGKTLAGLAAAFTLREKLSTSEEDGPRIIYALPFTSIIDQTFNTIQEVLNANRKAQSDPIPSSMLLKHHYLTAATYRQTEHNDSESLSLDQALLLIESWQSEIIVTTFVQLLHTLVGCENRMLKKFHRLQNAILILDEVQNIPVEHWPLVEKMLTETCEHLNTRVLMMTATRPEWFREGATLELAGSQQKIRQRFSALDRISIKVEPKPITVEELAEKFEQHYSSKQSYLVIMNTIKSSIGLYCQLKKKLAHNAPLYYLSTNITPLERACRLKQIRTLLENKEKPILISTQVVEAGVDLDFDEVWRDLGPVDAVIQAAGRCNRHSAHKRSLVRLWHLVNRTEKSETPLAQYVYGKIHTYTAKKTFEAKPLLQESDFYATIADYFETIRQAESAESSKKLLEAIHHWRFSPRQRDSDLLGVANFALIENRPHYVSVFVELNKNAVKIWGQYQATVVNEKDHKKRRQAYLSLKHDFSNYLLSVPMRLVLRQLDSSTIPLRIPKKMLNEFYDPETGFKHIDNDKVLIY